LAQVLVSEGRFLEREFGGLQLGDSRRNRRAVLVARRIMKHPRLSFPDMLPTEAELTAAYRLFGNGDIDPDDVSRPHYSASADRAAAHDQVLVVHDSSEIQFSGEAGRRGLSPLRHQKGQSGFLFHAALGLVADGSRRPLGILGSRRLVRRARPKSTRTQRRESADNERLRWGALIREVEGLLAGKTSAIHVMDREADDFANLADLVQEGWRFVVRLHYDRKLEGGVTIREVVSQAQCLCEREVELGARVAPSARKARRLHPARKKRTARLEVRSARVELLRSHSCRSSCTAESVVVNVVQARELDAPSGVEPVEWTIITTEPVETAEQALQVVDWYRARWVIEEYFKALKTGCAYEARQLESRDALFIALALMIPIAWRLLLLRSYARAETPIAAREVLSVAELEVMRHHPDIKLRRGATAQEALLAIARHGGHLKRNGEPGWQVIARGFAKLVPALVGWSAAKQHFAT